MMAKRMSKQPKLSEQVRQAIETCGRTRYRLSKETGISQSMLSRFMAGDRGLSMAALDVLAENLGLQIVVRQPPKPKGR